MLLLLNQCFALVLVVSSTSTTAAGPAGVVVPCKALSAPTSMTMAGGAVPIRLETNRDKTGTNPLPRNAAASQMAKNMAKAGCISFEAEGKGFEPSTGFPAPDFESSRCCPLGFSYSGIAGFSRFGENAIEPKYAVRCAL
jgi:hypothetical protein